MVDSRMPEILAYLVYVYYTERFSRISDLTPFLAEYNPCKFSVSAEHPFYEQKIKNLLVAAALGMNPSSVWNGTPDVTGGYIIVKADGELVCYHIYNWNDFQEYLYQNCKFDTPSTSRHQFGKLYPDTESGDVCMNLNFQIRFE